MQRDDSVRLEDAFLTLDGKVAVTLHHGVLQLTDAEAGSITLSPLAQAQLLEHLYHRRGSLYRQTTLDLEGVEAPDWVRSDPQLVQWLIEGTLAESSASADERS